MIRTFPLDAGWTVRAAAGPVPEGFPDAEIPAAVPGVVHTDLLAAGLIPDPYLDDNESLLAWIGLVDWTYRTSFSRQADAGARYELVFDGLDTVATVTLNGTVLGEVANQHRRYRFDAGSALRDENVLEVAFRSPVKYADAQSLVLGARPRPYPTPFEAIRKSACSFGWDWGIATAMSGIWRPARLESWSVARLDDVLVQATAVGGGGRVAVDASVVRDADVPLEVQVEAAGVSASVVVPAGSSRALVSLDLDAVERWWPVGHGAQPLYDVTVSLLQAGEPLDETTRRVGFRTLHWDTEADADGTPFRLVVNDRPIYVKGANWIPDDAFPSRVDRGRYERRLRQAVRANLNLIRVWGGGVYESDDFFGLCDELGLLTWQDFLFACAAYPEEEPIRSEVAAEARENVARIGHHASLALLNANNENLWGYEDWGWKRRLDGATWGGHYYRELLPTIVGELAPHVPYTPGSPFSPRAGALDEAPGLHPNDEHNGTMHLWEQWNRLDWPTYRGQRPRFVAEFGWQGPPAWSTLTRALSDDPLTPESPGMIVHQKAIDGTAKLVDGLIGHYRVPSDMDGWHWAMQLNQADAVGCALGWFRSLAPLNAGAIVWQLNDCWPVTSWAAIDGDGCEKPLFFAMRNAFAPRIVSIQPAGDGLVAVLGNDTDDAWEGTVVLTRRAFDGAVLETAEEAASVAPRGTIEIAIPDAVSRAGEPGSELVVAEAPGARGVWFLAEPRDSALPAADARISVAAADEGFDATVTARALLRDVFLMVDRLDPAASVDEGLVTLLPGESVVFRVRGVAALTADDVARVLRTANELVSPAESGR